jgi:hypothetical protein
MVKDSHNVELSDAQIDLIADRAASKVIAVVQLEIGKGALRALLYVVGATVVAAVAWLTAHGFLKGV